MKTNKQQQVSEARNKQTISKLEKQQTEKRKQNTKYTKAEKKVFPLTRTILIKHDFMTLIFVSFLNKHYKKECVHCRNYNYIIVKKFVKYN